jgi:hypothetical protein
MEQHALATWIELLKASWSFAEMEKSTERTLLVGLPSSDSG